MTSNYYLLFVFILSYYIECILIHVWVSFSVLFKNRVSGLKRKADRRPPHDQIFLAKKSTMSSFLEL